MEKILGLGLGLGLAFIGSVYGAEEMNALQPVASQAVQDNRLDEIIVTARRRSESVQTVPLAITALDSQALQVFRVRNMDDLQRFDPSFTVSSAGGRANAPEYSLRGIRPTEAIYGQDPTVAIYLADVVMSPARGSNLGMYDLASAQVLKGPQGTLFGRNTTGGAILLTPQRPANVFGGYITAGMGRYDHKETEFGVDIPLAENFTARIAGKVESSDGYQTNVAPGPYEGRKQGGGRKQSARLSMVWDVTDRVENYTILTWDELHLNGRTGVLQAVNPNSPAGFYTGNPLPSIYDALERAQNRSVHKIESDLRETSEVDVWGIINTTTVDVNNNLTFKSIAAYRDLNSEEVADLDATAIPNLLSTGPDSGSLEHGSLELQLMGTAFEDRLDWIAGFYSYYEDGTEVFPAFTLAALQPASANPFVRTTAITNRSYSLFGQGTYRLNEAWSITAGTRWTYDDREMKVSSRTAAECAMFNEVGARLPEDACWFSMEKSFDQPTGAVSLEYKPNADAMFYLASRYGYRSGGFNGRAAENIGTEPFDPETVVDLEGGGKLDWGLGSWLMRTNFAVYHQWYDDIQRTVAVQNQLGVPVSTVQNAAQATVFGVEIDQTIEPTESLSLRIQYAYTKPEYDQWRDPSTGHNLSGTPFAFTPKHSATATVSYEHPLDGDRGLMRFAVSASWQDDMWINPLQTSRDIAAMPRELHRILQQEAHWLVNLSLGWERIMGSNLDVTGYVKNLTNEEYTVGGVPLYPSLGISTKVFGEPRTYGFQLRYEF